MDQPKIERVLRLMTLLICNASYTVQDLAQMMSTTPRSIYRYMDTLKGAGFVVERVNGTIYRCAALKRPDPDLSKMVYFSEKEAAIVANMSDRLDETNVLKQGLKRKLATVYYSTSIADFIDKKSNAANVQALADAIKGKKQVILHGYESANSGEIRDRKVEPFSFTTNYIDIWAYDLEDGINKRFKIVRIDEFEVLNEPWAAEKSHKVQPIDCFCIHGHRPTKVKILLSQRAKNLLLEEYSLAEKYVKKSRNKMDIRKPCLRAWMESAASSSASPVKSKSLNPTNSSNTSQSICVLHQINNQTSRYEKVIPFDAHCHHTSNIPDGSKSSPTVQRNPNKW